MIIITTSNLLKDNFPELRQFWGRNELDFDSVTIGSRQVVKWTCTNGHTEERNIKDTVRKVRRNKNLSLCNYCNNRELLVGFNDMWTTNPILASKLENKELGYQLFQFGSQIVNWKCPDCGNIIKNKRVRDVATYGLSCNVCSVQGFSFGERYIRSYLITQNIEFFAEKIFRNIPNFRYDFFLPKFNTVIEVHGAQHYDQTFFKKPVEQQKIDKKKEEMLLQEGITLVVFDARKSDLNYLKSSHKNNSLLNKIIDYTLLSNEELVYELESNLNIEITNNYNNIIKPTVEDISVIANRFHITETRVKGILTRMSVAGLCEYREHTRTRRNKRLAQTRKNSAFQCIWESISSAERYYSELTSSKIGAIKRALYKNTKRAYDSNWEYYDK